MFRLRLLPAQPLIKFNQQLPISNWAYPFHRDEDRHPDQLAAYATPKRAAVRRRAVYIHIPFCETICNFCPFYRGKYKSGLDIDQYLNALVAEMDLKRNIIGYYKVNAIFVGGGTPSLLSPPQIELLGQAIARNFDLNDLTEFTFEVEVKSVSPEKLQAMRAIGVNRVSFGVQTFSETYRALFSLDATEKQIREAAALVNSMFPYTNMDLLYGMAGQNLDQLHDDIAAAVRLKTRTIDVYPINNLAASRAMHVAVARAGLDLLPAATRLQFRVYIDELFQELGYAPISGYSYAISDETCKDRRVAVQHSPKFHYHDILYGHHDDEIIGYGSSALSQIPGFNLYNPANRQAYVTRIMEGGALPHISFGPVEAPERGIVFLPYRGVLEKRRVPWDEVPDETLVALRQAEDAELIVDQGNKYEITKVGWLFYVNLMYYLMPAPGKRWVSDKIERQQQAGRSSGNTDLTELIPLGV
jgi:coproporphyrinogen III oxidase-like Fe-S oxidoreductase